MNGRTLENKPRSQLNLARTVRDGIDCTERRACYLRVRRSERRMIQYIECFDTKLRRLTFTESEILDYRCVEIVDTVLPVLTERGRDCPQMKLILGSGCRYTSKHRLSDSSNRSAISEPVAGFFKAPV
jgi:hypothetical protein